MEALLKLAFNFVVKSGDLTVIRANGSKLKFGDGTGGAIVVRFADASAEREFVLDAGLKLAELYTDGRLLVEEGTLLEFANVMLKEMRDIDTPRPFNWVEAAQMTLMRHFPSNRPTVSRQNVEHHYDLGDDLYELFLDKDWQYSCAYFDEPGLDLDQAQLAKKRHIAAKLLIHPGDTVLDVGCGWGGLALYLATAAGAGHVTGVTLSTEQIARATQRAADAGLERSVAFKFQDFRAVQGQFDRLVSVGMFEHVGLGFYDTFFRTSRRLLKEDGVMLLHTIGLTGSPGPTNPWVLKNIFPGGHLPALSDIVQSAQRSGLLVADVETLGPHYAKTLAAWRERFTEKRAIAASLYDERFCRMWEFYLTMAEVSFRNNDITLYQVQLTRDRNRVPMSRSYIGDVETKLRAAELAAGF